MSKQHTFREFISEMESTLYTEGGCSPRAIELMKLMAPYGDVVPYPEHLVLLATLAMKWADAETPLEDQIMGQPDDEMPAHLRERQRLGSPALRG